MRLSRGKSCGNIAMVIFPEAPRVSFACNYCVVGGTGKSHGRVLLAGRKCRFLGTLMVGALAGGGLARTAEQPSLPADLCQCS